MHRYKLFFQLTTLIDINLYTAQKRRSGEGMQLSWSVNNWLTNRPYKQAGRTSPL